MEYEMRGLCVSGNSAGIEKMRVLQMGRLDTYRRMLESDRSVAREDKNLLEAGDFAPIGKTSRAEPEAMGAAVTADGRDEREECGENA